MVFCIGRVHEDDMESLPLSSQSPHCLVDGTMNDSYPVPDPQRLDIGSNESNGFRALIDKYCLRGPSA